MANNNYYITTPIYYVNDKPHIGHAYTSLACDVLARFKRLQGYNVRFLTGTDEHGQKVEKAAKNRGVSPQIFTDEVSKNFQDLCEAMNFSIDDFIRTTEGRHKDGVQALWVRLQERGAIYLDSYDGWYAVRDEAFYTDSEITTNQKGEKIGPTGAEVEWVSEPSYFFKLSDYTDKLLNFYEENPDFIAPSSRRNEVISFVKGGLKDLSISRTTFSWGIEVPKDEKHVIYVWLDALANYITALQYPDEGADLYKNFWPANIHMVGKDILRFHAVYWPAFLMAAGLPLPKRIFAHGWWTNEGQKISKSVGNVIDPYQLVQEYGRDATRYFLMREVPFGNDGDFNKQQMIQRINHDLANDLGNLCMRVFSMAYKNCEAKIPAPNGFEDMDIALQKQADDMRINATDYINNQQFNRALEEIWTLIAKANKYVDATAPWALRKSDYKRMETVLYCLMDVIRHIAIILQAFMPEKASDILDQLAIPPDARQFIHLKDTLPHGTAMPKPSGIFPRYDASCEYGVKNAE